MIKVCRIAHNSLYHGIGVCSAGSSAISDHKLRPTQIKPVISRLLFFAYNNFSCWLSIRAQYDGKSIVPHYTDLKQKNSNKSQVHIKRQFLVDAGVWLTG